MLNKTFLVLSFLLSAHAFAQTPASSELTPLLNGTQPALEVMFAHDEDVNFFISVSFKGNDLTDGNAFNSLSYRYQDAATGELLTEWKLFEKSVTPTRLSGSYLLQASNTVETGARLMQKSLKTLQLLILVNENTQPILKTLSFGKFCESSPKIFKDLTTGRTGCEITP